jgi:protein SCO1
MILTPDGKLSRYFYGINYAPSDLRYGLEDASAGRIGSPVVQQLRLLCFGYDPAKGKYTLAVLRLVQLGGVLTIVLLGGYMTINWLRDRRKGLGPTPAG